ncbi:MAG: phosphoribosylformylglycinamidine synthase subunit PurL [Ignavibacteriales bacterium]|nr:phosphoribosylformylglycinamidine synthase subunit PurL [Ignavibacteriales bacterium]
MKQFEEPVVTKELAKQHGLTDEEFEKVLSILDRVPTYTELGIYSVMWSEHCSYKNSIAQLKTLPRSGKRLLVGAGEENAGLVDIGDGLAVAFKIESHNHPSAVEPYQGAATGVGGIMRDIFTMGARPIASLNSLRFGDIDDKQTRHLLKGVVKGIGDYGNSFGVPTVAGEVYFDPCYQTNPLVNAMSIGIVEHGHVASAIAKGEGNVIMIVGSATGRDGIHGATFASEEISEASESKRPSVQVGDPFTEKLLLEATLEAIRAGLIVGIQDMGAAGLTCSSTEMSAKGNSGMELNLDLVPIRETHMTAYEIMLSESQERMLLVAEPKNEQAIKSIFEKWDLNCITIGKVTSDGMVRIYHQGKLKAEVPAETCVLGGGAPVYIRETKKPDYLAATSSFNVDSLSTPKNLSESIYKLIQSPNIASRRWVFEQYDSMVRTNSVVLPGSDAAVVRIKKSEKLLAAKTDCNGRYVYLNPRKGTMIAVAESGRNVVCTGGKPIAITNCLNFGNPYKPEVYWQFTEAIAGMREACLALDTPVTGGNVSFYNESPTASVFPTPTIGMLGIIEKESHVTTANFKEAGDAIYLLGTNRGDICGSEFLFLEYGIASGDAPFFELAFEVKLQQCALEMIQNGLIKSAHDISEGGLIVSLLESAIVGREKFGFEIKISAGSLPLHRILFGEDQSRIVITSNEKNGSLMKKIAEKYFVPFDRLGTVTQNMKATINSDITLDIEKVDDLYFNALHRSVSRN